MKPFCYVDKVTGYVYEAAPKYTFGLDLGQVKDYTALCVLERHGEGDTAIYHARHLQRFALGTPYPAIVVSVAEMLRQPYPLEGEGKVSD
jgi:hypothetical protein